MGEFERKYGSFRAGISGALSYALTAIIVPILLAIALNYIIENYNILTEFSSYAKDFGSIIVIGGVLTCMAFLIIIIQKAPIHALLPGYCFREVCFYSCGRFHRLFISCLI